ncbi:TPA: hypothetical protein ACGVV9_001712 [Enterococcus faecium]
MSISEENMNKLTELSGAQYPTHSTQKKLDHALRRFKYNFPSLNWWGNTPIEPTGAGLTYAESITWIRNMLHHLSDWAGQMNDELDKLIKDLNDLELIIKLELADQLPDIIDKFKLFGIIVTGNNEHLSLAATQTTTVNSKQSVFTYAFRTEWGFIEATKTNLANDICDKNNATWAINSREISNDEKLDFVLLINNIPTQVNRLWIVNKENSTIKSNKELYFIYKNQIRKAEFGYTTANNQNPVSLNFDKLNTNYEPQWIVNVFKRVPNNKNYLHYLTTDYKCYEYDLDTGEEKLLYEIPIDKQDIFDPISDVIEGKSTIWAITYKGTTNRYLKEMNGLCFEPCFDSVEMYDIWENPKKLIFTDRFSGITPANMYQNYANHDENEGDKSLLSSFILSYKDDSYNNLLKICELSPKHFDNKIVSGNLDKYFKDSILKELYNNNSLADFQGYYIYDVTKNIENFIDAPLYLLNDSKKENDGAKFLLENSKFTVESNIRTFHQKLSVITADNDSKRTLRVFDRVISQVINIGGFSLNSFSRWYDSSKPTVTDKIMPLTPTRHFDYLSLAGSHRVFNAKEFENVFDDTPLKTYKYYELPLKKDHPLFSEMENKNIIVGVTKGTNYEKDSSKYEIVIKLTYQDDYAELQFRRVMRFERSDNEGKFGGRNKASYISPWAYVYYTKPDDSAPPGYEDNPNQGIDKEFQDIINNLQQQINNNKNEINNIKNELGDIKKEINNMKQEIQDIKNMLNSNQEAFKKLLQHLENIHVWQHTGDDILKGNFAPGMGVAGGNINVFTGSADGNTWIRTNPGKTENDIVAGV